MSLKAFYAELKKGLPAPAYIINADDAALLKEAVIEVRSTVPKGEQDFKYHTFDLDSPDKVIPLEHIIDTLNTIPFMGGRQTVTLENLHKLKAADQKPLVSYMESPSPDSALVITYVGKPRKTLINKLKGVKSISVGIMERDMPFWIKERATKNGIELTKDAIEFLIGTVGADAGLLASEVEKFTTLGKKKLAMEDIREIVTGSGDYSPFDLVEALKAGKAEDAFKIYAVLQETQEPYGLLGVLNWHYGKMHMKPAQRTQVFKLLSDADLLVKSAGGTYPLEHLLAKLLRT